MTSVPSRSSGTHPTFNVNVDKEGKGRRGSEEPSPSPNTLPSSLGKKASQGEAEPKTDLHKLPNIDQPKEKTDLIASDILAELGDQSSKAFYRLVAAKIPESFIRQKLSELKQGNAHAPERVFASIIRTYAAERLAQQKIQSISYATQGLFRIGSP
jgi:hypothetical protein